MTTALVNKDINTFSEKLKIYNGKLLSVINGEGGLFSETKTIRDTVDLGLSNSSSSSSETPTYSTDQFGKFIRKVVNFNIKNYDALGTERDLGFVKNVSDTLSYHTNNTENIIDTLKTINVFVDILEAYKYCIDKETDATLASGYSLDTDIDRIELVTDKTRFYTTSGGTTTMVPSGDDRNIGYIRKAGGKTVLFLSIQSFKTNITKDNYEKWFTKSGTTDLSGTTNILHNDAKGSVSYDSTMTDNYKYQSYDETVAIGALTGLTLEQRNKKLVVLLLKTLFGLNKTYRKQSVFALYYYYKFVQLYSAFIINVSNVMYNDVKKTSKDEPSPYRIDTYNMTTNSASHMISAIEYTASDGVTKNSGSTYTDILSIIPTTVGTPPTTAASFTIASGAVSSIVRGVGYRQDPTLTVSQSTNPAKVITAKATIVPMVYQTTDMSNDNNIKRLEDVITEINSTITFLLNDLTTNDSALAIVINTVSADSTTQTSAYMDVSNRVVIRVNKQGIYDKIIKYRQTYDLENDFIIYDKINKKSYDIIQISDDTANSVLNITINAVYDSADIILGTNTKIFTNPTGEYITKPANITTASPYMISHGSEFLELSMKDMNAYKDTYITTRNDITKLDEDIGYMTNKVVHQNNLYETQNNKKVFIDRQVLAYNIILAIIVLILVGINVVKVDKQIVKTVSLSCLGVIILLFVIYFISNMTYVETFASSSDLLFALSYDGLKANVSTTGGSGDDPVLYKKLKFSTLNSEITKLNTRFISYFEKLIIMLPASDNFDFYKEISEVISNDKENKEFTNKTLGYSKNQNNNNINSLKYELENNKLYLNTILISAIIFVGLYNMYINYLTDDKYLSLMIFVCMIIFIIILSYYYITANRRVKTVFKSIYWGPEFSKRF